MNFAGRLFVGIVVTLLVSVGVMVWSAEVSLRGHLDDNFASALEGEARLVRDALPADSAAWGPVVQRMAAVTTHRITLVDPSGRVIMDSEVPASQLGTLENHGNRPEIAAALAGGTGSAGRESASLARRLLYVAVPGGPGVVRVAASVEQVDRTVRQAQRSIVIAALLALLVGTVLAFVAGQAVARPLTGIISAAGAISAGAAPRFPHSGIPDIDALVRALRDLHVRFTDRLGALRQEQEETTAMIDAMAEGVIAADQRGRVLNANASARRMLGYAPSVRMPDLPQLFRAKAARGVIDAALRGNSVAGRELEMDDRILSFGARPFQGGGLVLVMRDVTEIRRLEAVRRDFVANVSHELKTPLTSISGYSETLLTDQPDPETTRRFLQVILVNARRMQRLVDSLLDLSRIESGRWQPALENVDVRGVMESVVADCRDRAAGRSLVIEVQVTPVAERMVADEDALRHVLLNLIDNALRYTPPGGTVVCRASEEDGGITISVSDTGSGITRDHLPRIFERFYRADPSRSRDEGGTGLGLAIVKHLVEAHGGRVSADSEWGKGTTVSCFFPAAGPEGK